MRNRSGGAPPAKRAGEASDEIFSVARLHQLDVDVRLFLLERLDQGSIGVDLGRVTEDEESGPSRKTPCRTLRRRRRVRRRRAREQPGAESWVGTPWRCIELAATEALSRVVFWLVYAVSDAIAVISGQRLRCYHDAEVDEKVRGPPLRAALSIARGTRSDYFGRLRYQALSPCVAAKSLRSVGHDGQAGNLDVRHPRRGELPARRAVLELRDAEVAGRVQVAGHVVVDEIADREIAPVVIDVRPRRRAGGRVEAAPRTGGRPAHSRCSRCTRPKRGSRRRDRRRCS